MLTLITNITENLVITQEFLVVDSITNPGGKYPKALGNVVLLEAKYVEEIIKEQIQAIRDQPILANIDLIRTVLIPLLDPTQQDQVEEVLNILEDIYDQLGEFQDSFKINV